MKIAVVSSGHIPSRWAHSITTMKMADAFYQLGHKVEVLTVERFLEWKNKLKINDIYSFYGISRGIKVNYFRDNALFYFKEVRPLNIIPKVLERLLNERIKYYYNDPEARISRYCRESGVDLCYCRTYRTVFYNVSNKVPTVVETITTHVRNRDFQKIIEASRSRYFKCLLTISEGLKEKYVGAGVPENKVLVVEPGVRLEDFQNLPPKIKIRKMLGIPKGKKVVVYSGSLFPNKGIEDILLTAKRVPKALFILVGGNDVWRRKWEEYARRHKIGNVRFIGFVENRYVPLYLKASDALIMPYRITTKQEEILLKPPLKLFEYMAAERPIVSTNIPTIARIITHGVEGLLAEPNNINQLAEFVNKVLEDEGLARRLASNAYRKSLRYDWKERVRRVLNFCGA